MTKYYISDGKHRFLIDKDSKAEALNAYAEHWLGRGSELGPQICIDNRGFANHEAADEVLDTNDVLRRVDI